MPRHIAWKPRLIHPTSATSVSLAKLSALAELLWWKIIPQCDDQGRIFGDAASIKIVCCPLRAELILENIPTLLKELEQANLVKIYTNNKTFFLQVISWWEYQTPQWAYPSRIPPLPKWKDKLRYREGNKVITINWRTPSTKIDGSLKKGVRFEIFKRDSFTCQYCGRKAPEVILELDHVNPRSNQGSNNPENYMTSCIDCNRGKGSKLL